MNKGRMNLAEELGRIDARRDPNANDMAEKNRVIGELNAGYKNGGKVRGCGMLKRKRKGLRKKFLMALDIKKAIKKPGSLRKSLGIKKGKKIPAKCFSKSSKKTR